MDGCVCLGVFWEIVSVMNVGGLGGKSYFNAAFVMKTSLFSQPSCVHFRDAFSSNCVCWLD
jgi:hypothetical protein